MKLEVSNGTFYYKKDKPVIQNVNLDVQQGDIVSVLGPNGIGKTTLLKCLLGFEKWKQGHTFFDGKDIQTIPSQLFFQKVAYVPQARYQAFPYTVFETVLLGRSAYLSMFETPHKEDEAKAYEAIKMCGISHLIDCHTNEISGGELQLCLIARALCTNPEMIVLDEVETGLDYANQMIVLNLLQDLVKKNNIAVIFNTHYPNHALDISNKSLLLQEKEKSLFGKTEEILTIHNLSNTFHVNIIDCDTIVEGKTYHSLIPVSLRREK